MINPNSGIKYVRTEIQSPPATDYSGVNHEALVPATLDLAERARLAINGMTEPTDPELDHRLYWKVSFRFNPPTMYHDHTDTHIIGKFMQAVPRMRLMCGSNQGLEVEERWKEVLLHMVSADGLLATPMVGRPWFRPNAQKAKFYRLDAAATNCEQIVDTWCNAICLGAVTTFLALDGKFWEPIGRGIADGLARMSTEKGDQAYIAQAAFALGRPIDHSQPAPLAGDANDNCMYAMGRLVQFYRQTGYEPALTLAGKLGRYAILSSQYWKKDGGFLCDSPDPASTRHHNVHFHRHTLAIFAALDYGLAAGDQEMIDFAMKAFQKGRTYGDCLTGFFPESANYEAPQTCEICEVADMVRIAVRMAESGNSDDCWDDVDRWTRNQLAEGQFLRHDWIERLHIGDPPSAIEDNMSTDRVGERNIGAFAGWQSPNDWVEFTRRESFTSSLGYVQGIMHCCTGNAAFALYDVWRNITRVTDDHIKVNLLLNYSGKGVRVDSHLPYTGQVDIHIHQGCRLSVRMPAWVNLTQVGCVVNNTNRELQFDGRYTQVGKVQPGDTVRLTFPLSERTDRVTIKNQWYFLVRKGHDVVFIDPPGQLCPLYQRDHYRDGMTLWKKADRFVSERLLDW